jgi:hypothetical protein
MYTRAAHQQLINQKGGKHAKLYNKTYIDGQSVLHGTNSSRGVRLPSAIYEFAILIISAVPYYTIRFVLVP